MLSSYGELQYALSDKPELRPFEPSKTALQSYPITEYQPLYYVAESFADAKERMLKFCQGIDRSFGVRYNPYTQSIDILDSKSQILSLVHNVTQEVEILRDALQKL